MSLIFKEITLSNIMGFGADKSTISFNTPGLFLITGNNGSGKSTVVLESLSFCLFGKPYRKTKISELINRKNNKKLYVKVTFDVGPDTFILERGLKPNILSISRNGEALDILSSKALTQDEIDRIIGIDYDMFKNIIALSLSYNKPFLTLPAMDKRSYIENIFNIKIFSDMLSQIKKENTDIKLKNDINTRALSIMENNMKSLRSNIKNIKNTISTFEKEKQKEVSSIKSCISKINTKNNSTKAFLEKLGSLSDIELNRSNLNSELNTNKQDLSKLQFTITSIDKDLKFYTENETCPTCNVTIDAEKRANIIKNNTAERGKLIHTTTILSKHISRMEEAIDKDSEKIDTIKNYTLEISYNEKEIKNYNDRLTVAENRTLSSIDIEALYSELELKSKEYSDLYQINEENKDTIRINAIIQAILQDDGIKTYFIQQLLPILNERINHYLNKFGLPLIFSFNERLEENIRSLEYYDDDISYYSHSEGEKKKIDLALLLSFIDVTKRITNWNTNILIFDELLDSALDTDSLDNIIGCIKDIIKENSEITSFIISHREIEGVFDGQIKIAKKDGFSTIL